MSKLRWWHETGSTRHAEDIESIISISGEQLDWAYLSDWAKKLGYGGLLDNVKK